MGEIKSEDVSAVALDTAILIYYVETHPTYCPLVEPVIEAIDKAKVVGITSTIASLWINSAYY